MNRAAWNRRQQWLDLLKDKPCMDCGGMFSPECMDFDHVRGTKRMGVTMLCHKAAKEAVLEEVNKCDLVCANCHRTRTKKRSRVLPVVKPYVAEVTA